MVAIKGGFGEMVRMGTFNAVMFSLRGGVLSLTSSGLF